MSNNPNSMNAFPNGQYGPFGYNDNNQNRQRVPSNVFPPNGGRQGSSSGRFDGLTTNSQGLMNTLPSMTNFSKAFQPNAPIIETMDYMNHNQLLHNNVGESVFAESIVEYKINIDSLDRDINAYRDPFAFTVIFDPPSTTSMRIPVKDYNNKSCNKGPRLEKTVVHGPPKPHILKEFKNVKFIRLDSIVLPIFTKTKVDENGEIVFDPNSRLLDDRYIILRIKELDDDKSTLVYDTGDDNARCCSGGIVQTYPKPFGIIYPDKIIGRFYFRGCFDYAMKTYKSSTLGNIGRLTIELFDSCGEPIRFNDLIDVCKEECADPADLRHPFNNKIQIFLSMTIGVVESQVNTNTKFEL